MKIIGMVPILLFAIASLGGAQPERFMMVFLTIDPNRPQLPQQVVDSLQALHMANIGNLAKEGKLLAAGPFDGGGGIFVFATTSIDTAKQWLSTDPAVRSRRWIVETIPYVPRIGSICRVGEKYEMTTYTFVRFNWEKQDPLGQLTQLVNADSLIAAGTLERSGGILVVRGSVDESAIKNDRVVLEGKIGASVHRLFIAKGSFCEK